MPRILVTGGCGFIGGHLTRRLLAEGARVAVLDDLSTGATAAPGAEIVEGDIRDAGLVARLVGESDLVYHLAAVASVTRSAEDWTGTHAINAGGTVAVLDAARARQVPVIYASSAAIYGDQPHHPVDEQAPARPLSAYGVDKLTAEGQAAVAGRLFQVPTLGLRFFNVYGPGQRPDSPYSGVISRFVDLARRGQRLTINGDGGQTRDFVYVTDVVDALMRARGAVAVAAPVANICTGTGITVLDLAATINRLTGNHAANVFRPSRASDIYFSIGVPDRARALLGFVPATPFDEGLRATIDWMATV
ncbi:MAG: NAD-dependent epimerase/dehydratase family protein [Azospirillaceae bacterium]